MRTTALPKTLADYSLLCHSFPLSPQKSLPRRGAVTASVSVLAALSGSPNLQQAAWKSFCLLLTSPSCRQTLSRDDGFQQCRVACYDYAACTFNDLSQVLYHLFLFSQELNSCRQHGLAQIREEASHSLYGPHRDEVLHVRYRQQVQALVGFSLS